MSDTIPFPSADPVDLEVLRAFHDDYVQLQNVEEKKVLLRMKDEIQEAGAFRIDPAEAGQRPTRRPQRPLPLRQRQEIQTLLRHDLSGLRIALEPVLF